MRQHRIEKIGNESMESRVTMFDMFSCQFIAPTTFSRPQVFYSCCYLIECYLIAYLKFKLVGFRKFINETFVHLSVHVFRSGSQ